MMRQTTNKNEIQKDNLKQKDQNQDAVFEDLPYEKEIKEKREKEKKKTDYLLKKKESAEAISKIQKNKALTKRRSSLKKSVNKNNKSNISDDLSCLGDLSLPKIGDNIPRKNTTLNRINSFLVDYDNEYQKGDQSINNKVNSNNIENENENDITNKSLISNSEDKLNLRTKILRLKEKEDIYSKVEFNKPYSILTSVIDLKKDKEIQEKYGKLRKNFKLDKYLEKETERGINVDSLGRRKSFLDFLQYTEKKKNLEDYLEEDKKEISDKDFLKLLNKNKKEEEEKIGRDSLVSDSEKDNDSQSQSQNRNEDIQKINNNLNTYNNKSRLEEMIEDKYQNNY